MPRVLVIHTLGFVIGIIIGNLFLVPISAAFACALAALVFSVLVLIKGRDVRLLVVFTLCVGLFWGQVHSSRIPPYPLASGAEFQGGGIVAAEPRTTSSGKIFPLTLKHVQRQIIPPMKIHVLCSAEEEVHYGDVLKIRGKVLAGSGASNPGQFDYEKYLKRQGIFYTVSTLYEGRIENTGENRGNFFMKSVIRLKEKMDGILAHLPPRQQSFIGGMLFGNKGGLTFTERNVLSQTGLMDAFAVSGVHVGYVVLFTLYFAQLLKLNKWGRFLLVFVAVLFYAALSEFTSSVLRSGSMALLGLLAYSLGERKDFFTGLALAALALLIWNPEMIYDAGFQLSFAASGGVVYLVPLVEKWLPQKTWGKLLAAALAAHLAIMPLIAYYFNVVTLSGLIIGILASGLVGLVVLLGLFSVVLSIFSTWLAVLPAYGAGIIVEGIWRGAELVSRIPGSYLIVKTPSLLLLALFYGFLVIWPYLAKEKKGQVISAALSFILVLCLVWPVPGSGRLTVTFLDVGQGDSIFIRSPSGRTCLIDGGGKPGDIDADRVGEQVIIPYLQNMGLGNLDLVALTHPHDDHMNGLLAVLKHLKVDKLAAAEIFVESFQIKPLTDISQKKGILLIALCKGQEIFLDRGVKLTVLHPPRGKTPAEEEMNNSSLVLKLTYQDVSFLFTGDGETACLSSLCSGGNLPAQVLKLPHHGSKTGLWPPFYQQVAPKAVVISVGKNSFGHPAREVLEFWEEKNIPVYRTDVHGAITFSTDGRELWVETFLH